ncbi:hypothetical protein HC766_05325 [Candidatus Gracilibacteria bacterium]|nr:hypothetical protein [Candidatus Gracilibacteria bacterium]
MGNILIPQLPPNSITVWDNATYHKSKKIKQLLEKHGHTIIFLPPYSPDLNPIEKLWGTLKQNLRSYFDETKSLTDNLIEQINRLCVKVGCGLGITEFSSFVTLRSIEGSSVFFSPVSSLLKLVLELVIFSSSKAVCGLNILFDSSCFW